jgi:serine/threonine protein kinase
MSTAYRNALPEGTRLEEYRVERVLGAGGFGMTYLAHDENLGARVAIKEYLPADLAVRDRDLSVQPRSENDRDTYGWGLARFREEAQTLARFSHPNIVRVLRYLAANNTAYMVMQYEDGESLRELLKRKQTLGEAEVRALLDPLLEGLGRVHAAGVLHRDIKPGNIYTRRAGSPVLLDFGAARQAVGERSRSMTAVLTPPYAPIEQYGKGQAQGAWTDIYALGVVAYEALSGQHPPDATDRIIDDRLVPLATAARSRCSDGLLAAVTVALEVKAANRPQTTAAWRAMLTGRGEVKAPAPTPAPAPRPHGVYDVAPPKRVNHVLKAVLYGGTTIGCTGLIVSESKDRAALLLLLLLWPLLTACTRNLHALVARPHLRLTRAGIQLRYWRPAGFISIGMFLPVYRMVERVIGWSDYVGTRTFTHSVNGIPNWKAVIVESKTEVHDIGWDIFAKRVGALQTAILDYIEVEFYQPTRAQYDVAGFCRMRFAKPLRIASSAGIAGPVIALGLSAAACVVIKALVPAFPNTGWIWIPLILAGIGVFMLAEWVRVMGKRVLELRADGVAFGNSFDDMRVIRWGDILFIRGHTKVIDAKKGTSAHEALEIRRADRSSVILRANYTRTLADLEQLIEPPVGKIEDVRQRLAAGEDLERACLAAGLPGREVAKKAKK